MPFPKIANRAIGLMEPARERDAGCPWKPIRDSKSNCSGRPRSVAWKFHGVLNEAVVGALPQPTDACAWNRFSCADRLESGGGSVDTLILS